MSAPGDACQRFEPSTQVHSRNLCCRCGLSEQDHKSAPGLVTELVECLNAFLNAWKKFGFDQPSLPGCEPTIAEKAREVLARATPDAVRMADAAPAMYEALKPWRDDPVMCAPNRILGRSAPQPRCDCWACERTTASCEAPAKADGKP